MSLPRPLVVTTTHDVVDPHDRQTSLREAIASANASPGDDTITFARQLAGATLVLTQGQIEIEDATACGDTGALVIEGGAGTVDQRITIDAGEQSRIFGVHDRDVTLQSLALVNGRAPIELGEYTYNAYGGAIRGSGSLWLRDTHFIDNAAEISLPGQFGAEGQVRGGAIDFVGSVLAMDSIFKGNAAFFNYLVGTQNAAGGAIYASAVVQVDRATFSDNFVAGYTTSSGGAIDSASVRIVDSAFSDNGAFGAFSSDAISAHGGAIDTITGTVERSSFTGNQLSAFYDASTTSSGGAIRAQDSLTVEASFFGSNFGGARGGAIDGLGIVSIANSSLVANRAFGSAAVEGDQVRLVNATVTGNIGTIDFGDSSGAVAAGAASIANTILVGNVVQGLYGYLPGDLSVASLASNGHNLFGQAAVPGASAGDLTGVDARDVFADTAEFGTSGLFYGIARDNGGRSPTVALLPSGPAVDCGLDADAVGPDGNPLEFDQRGPDFVRIVDLPGIGSTVDIGAFELQAGEAETPGLVVTTLADAVDATDGQTSLREAVLFANASAGDDTITFDASLAGGTLVLTQGQIGIADATPGDDTGALIIDGSAGTADQRVTIDANEQSRHFEIHDGDVALQSLELVNGRAPVVALGNYTYNAYGGAILGSGSLWLRDTQFRANQAKIEGPPGQYGERGDGQVRGGAIDFIGNVHVIDSYFKENAAFFDYLVGSQNAVGGAIHASDIVQVESSIFTNNYLGSYNTSSGGAIKSASVRITDSAFNNNFAGGPGDGSISYGGAIDTLTGTIGYTVFGGNVASGGFRPGSPSSGGAVRAHESLTVLGSLFDGNYSNYRAGAIFSPGSVSVTNSSIVNNFAYFSGAALEAHEVQLVNATVTGNFVSLFAAPGEVSGALTANTAVVTNSVILGNPGPDRFEEPSSADISAVTLQSNGHNLFGQETVPGAIAGDLTGIDAREVFAVTREFTSGSPPEPTGIFFGVVQDNGGRSPTVALLPGGLAIDAGDTADAVGPDGDLLRFDQRGPGFPRTFDGNVDGAAVVDIGAFELGGPVLDFETDGTGNPLVAGQIIHDEFAALGISVTSSSAANPAMIFDSAAPSGGARSLDLGTPNADFGGPGIGEGGGRGQPGENARALGNVLIISADGDSGDPNEAALGGKLVFDFAAPVDLLGVTILDQDDGDRGVPNGEIFAYDDAGDLLATFATDELGDNSVQTLALDVEGVTRLEFAFVGSAAIDELSFLPATLDTEPDALLA